MAFDLQKAESFLEGGGGQTNFNESKAEAFLNAAPTTEPEQKIKRPQSKEWWVPFVVEYPKGFNTVVADTLGAPSDVLEWAVESLGFDLPKQVIGSESIKTGLRKIGVETYEDEIPDLPGVRAGQYTAIGMTFFAPILRFFSGVKKVTAIPGALKHAPGLIPPTGGTTKRVLTQIAKPAAQAPKAFLAGEIAGGGGAGIGSYYGKEYFGPEGELVGGLLGGLSPQVPISQAQRIGRFATKTLFPFTKRGARIKAEERLQGFSESSEEAAKKLGRKDVLPDAPVSVARLTEDRHLLAIEKAILKEDPTLYHQFRMDVARTNKMAREELQSLNPKVPPEVVREQFQARINNLTNLLDGRIQKALANSRDKISKLSPQVARMSASKIARDEIKKALGVAKKQEDELWGLIDEKSMANTATLKIAYFDILKHRTKTADPTEIPAFVRMFLGKINKNRQFLTDGKFSEQESIGELTTFRKRLLQVSSDERAKDATNWNKVRIINEMQEAILKDIEASPMSQETANALKFSRSLHERFDRGTVGQILGREKDRGLSVPSELTLEGTIGRQGQKGAVALGNIRKAADTPEVKQASEQYLRSIIKETNVINNAGRVNIHSAERFLIKNNEILEHFPQLKKELLEAIKAERGLVRVEKAAKSRTATIKQSPIHDIVESPPRRMLATILNEPYPDMVMAKALTRLDHRGKMALRGEIVNYLLNKSATGSFDEMSNPILSGHKMREMWKQNQATFSKAFNKKEIKTIQDIANTLRLSESIKDMPKVESIMPDIPNRLIDLFARVVGAQSGQRMASGMGSSLVLAQFGSQTARKMLKFFDITKSKQLIIDAFKDKTLMKALLTENTAGPKEMDKAARVIQGWMVANMIMSDVDDEIKELMQVQ